MRERKRTETAKKAPSFLVPSLPTGTLSAPSHSSEERAWPPPAATVKGWEETVLLCSAGRGLHPTEI